MIGFARSGFLGIIILVGFVCFSGAGSWALNNLKGLDSACYAGLSRMGAQAANPVCGAIAKGLAAMDDFAAATGNKIESWKNNLFGSTGLDRIDTLTSSLGRSISNLSSSGDDLARMISAGPSSFTGSGFQPAVDSFSIAQGFLKGGAPSQALPWLQQGAQQPQGFGLMSQLTLGNLYANGGQGVAANPQRAQYYLDQARQSIVTLSASNSPQSQQMLGTLPASPDKVRADIERAMLQIRLGKK